MTFRSRCRARTWHCFFDRPEPPLLQAMGCGRGSGKTAVGEAGFTQSAVKELCRAHEKGVLHLKIHRGKHSAHVEKSIEASRGLDSCPPLLLISMLPPRPWSVHLFLFLGVGTWASALVSAEDRLPDLHHCQKLFLLQTLLSSRR